MKNKKLKIEYIILGLVIISLLIYLILRNPNQVQYEIPEISQIKDNKIEKVEIIKNGVMITLSKKKDQWFIQPQDYPADQEKVKKLIQTISDLVLSDVISESKNYFKYGLDQENKITVKAYYSKDIIREFEIGKEAATYRHTFVKIPNDTRVFHARNSFRRDFEQKVADLRDKTVLKFNKSGINRIEMKSRETALVFEKKIQEVKIKSGDIMDKNKKPSADVPSDKPPQEFWSMPDGKIGKKGEIDSIISFLSNLSCNDYIEDKTKADFKEPLYQVTLKGTRDYTLFIYNKTKEKDNQYPALSSENNYPFWLSTYSAERAMKKLDDLIEKPKEK